MNRIITTSIVDPAIQQPLTGKSLDFLQDAEKSILLGLTQSIIGESYDNTKAYILKGLDAYGTNQYHEGYILYGGEVYYCAGKATTTAFSNLPIMTITVTNDATADPVEFTDLVSRNVHNNRNIVLSDGLTGTGTFDLSDAIYVQSNKKDKFLFAYAQSGTTEGATSDTAIFKYATEAFDANGWHSVSTGKIQPTESGTFEIDAHAEITIAASLSTFAVQLLFYKNGSLVGVMDSFFPYAGNNGTASVSGQWVAAANGSTDYFEIRMALTSSQAWTMTGNLKVRKMIQ